MNIEIKSDDDMINEIKYEHGLKLKCRCFNGEGGIMPPTPRYNTGMAFCRRPCQKLVKFFENFVSRGWQRFLNFL